MPLRERLCKYDTLAEFEKARSQRLLEAFVLAARGHRYGAVYLLGYFIEMSLKTAFFRALGFGAHETIRMADIKAAADLAVQDLGVEAERELLHSPVFWAKAITSVRNGLGLPLSKDLAAQLEGTSQRLNANWSVAMRYSHVEVNRDEWNTIREDALWIGATHGMLAGTQQDHYAIQGDFECHT